MWGQMERKDCIKFIISYFWNSFFRVLELCLNDLASSSVYRIISNISFAFHWFQSYCVNTLYRLDTLNILKRNETRKRRKKNQPRSSSNSFGVIVEAKHASVLLAAREIQYEHWIALAFNSHFHTFVCVSLSLCESNSIFTIEKSVKRKNEENMTEYHRCSPIASNSLTLSHSISPEHKAEEVIVVWHL